MFTMIRNYIISLVLTITIVLVLTGCGPRVPFGKEPDRLQPDLAFTTGSFLVDGDLEVRYCMTLPEKPEDVDGADSDPGESGNDVGDMILYLHGIGRSELEWVEENGFGSRYYRSADIAGVYGLPAVSVSVGARYMFIEDAPPPYDRDLETILIREIVPAVQELAGAKGRVFLAGHSLGGFNVLFLSLRHPDRFPVVTVFSPYTAPISPFDRELFEEMGRRFEMTPFRVAMIQGMLTGAFENEGKWYEYNPFRLLEQGGPYPYIIMSGATDDLPGFEWAIDEFDEALEEKGVDRYYCKSEGSHWTTCEEIFSVFIRTVDYLQQ
jgi:pimeloyl-ACP methyl ester carboxylesterase